MTAKVASIGFVSEGLASLTGRLISGSAVSEKRANTIVKQEVSSDHSLVKRAKKGDKDAYRELVERYQQRVLSVALGVIGNPHDAEDIVQDGFLKAYKNLDSFKGNSSFYTWLYRIVFNLSIDLSRKAYRKNEYSSDDSSKMDALSYSTGAKADLYMGKIAAPDKEFESSQIREGFRAALAELTEEHRAVVVLREIDGLSYAEISEVLGCSKGTVMSRLHHARKKLQSSLRSLKEAI